MDSVYRKVDLARSLRISSLLVVDSLLLLEDAILEMLGLVMLRLVEEVIGG